MDLTAPRPELWTRIAALLGALQSLLRGAVPDQFGGIAGEARARLAAVTALVRRYIHVLAADIALPQLPVGVSQKTSNATPTQHQSSREAPLRLTETTSAASDSKAGAGGDTPALQWALLFEAVRRLKAVMAEPRKHARRLAYLLRRREGPSLKGAPLPAAVLRRLPAWIDALICRLDEEARPEAWAGINAQGPPPSAG